MTGCNEKSHNIFWLVLFSTASSWYSYPFSFTLKSNLPHIPDAIFYQSSHVVAYSMPTVTFNVYVVKSFIYLPTHLGFALFFPSVYHDLDYIHSNSLPLCRSFFICLKNLLPEATYQQLFLSAKKKTNESDGTFFSFNLPFRFLACVFATYMFLLQMSTHSSGRCQNQFLWNLNIVPE